MADRWLTEWTFTGLHADRRFSEPNFSFELTSLRTDLTGSRIIPYTPAVLAFAGFPRIPPARLTVSGDSRPTTCGNSRPLPIPSWDAG